MKTLLLIISALFFNMASLPIIDEDDDIILDKDNTYAQKSISYEKVSARIDGTILSIDISNYSGAIYYQIEDIDGIADSGFSYISGSGYITKNLSRLNNGSYTLKIQTAYYHYSGPFSIQQ